MNSQESRRLFRSAPVIAVLLDREARFIDVSDRWVEVTGHGRDELVGRRPQDLATPESFQRITEEHLPLFRRTGRLDNVPVEFLARNGSLLEFLVTSAAVRRPGGDYLQSISVFTEISDADRMQRRYRDLYRGTPAMLHTVDAEGRIIEVSNHWLSKLGYARAEVLGRSILDFMTDASREQLVGRLPEIVRAGDRINLPRQMVTRTGEVLDVLMSAQTDRGPGGEVRRLLVAQGRHGAQSCRSPAEGSLRRDCAPQGRTGA